MLFSFDLSSDRKEFLDQNRHSLATFATRYKDTVIFIDEVQKCPESTNIIDQDGTLSYDEAQKLLQTNLIYGSLPNLENISSTDYPQYLSDFIEILLSKDILEIAHVTKSTRVFALAKLLALQIGQLVNVNKLAMLTELSRNSVYHYLDIFEQLNLIFRAYPLSTNNRRSISAKCKVYFTDIGLRNALIGNFSPLNSRFDGGSLLENVVFMGMKRHLDYTLSHQYELGFFRSINGSELDMIVKTDGKEQLYEIKTSPKYMNKKGIVTYITMQDAWEYLL